jgi:hypothetical protein
MRRGRGQSCAALSCAAGGWLPAVRARQGAWAACARGSLWRLTMSLRSAVDVLKMRRSTSSPALKGMECTATWRGRKAARSARSRASRSSSQADQVRQRCCSAHCQPLQLTTALLYTIFGASAACEGSKMLRGGMRQRGSQQQERQGPTHRDKHTASRWVASCCTSSPQGAQARASSAQLPGPKGWAMSPSYEVKGEVLHLLRLRHPGRKGSARRTRAGGRGESSKGSGC